MKIGFIGLGIMGKPMAANLLKAGYEVYLYNRSRAAVDEMAAKGGIPCSDAREAAEKSELILTMLPNSPEVTEVLTGEKGVLAGMRKGSVVADMSSIDPTVSIALEKQVRAAGGEMIDAPVSGGEPKAVDGTLSFMCGGKQEVFERVKPVLEKMGASVVRVGAIGSGNMAKLANQIIVASNIAALSEAMVLAAKAGVNPESVFRAIRGGLAGSTVMDAKMPMILERSFQPGFRIDLHVKDLNNAKKAAQASEAAVPLTDAVLAMLECLQSEGMGGLDHSALVRYYEELNQTEVRR